MTDKERAARQRAFEKGQQAAREGRHINRYPPASPDHERYEQGFETEMETIFD
jgi:hypothetical protein